MWAKILTTEKSYASVGKDGAVKCVAVGIPRPRFSWKWYVEGSEDAQILTKEVGLVGRHKVITEHHFANSTSYLMIKNVRRMDMRQYKCQLMKGDDVVDHKDISLVGYCKYFP